MTVIFLQKDFYHARETHFSTVGPDGVISKDSKDVNG